MKFLLLIANLSPALAFYAAFKRAIWGAPADHPATISKTIRTASSASRAAADGDLAALEAMLKDQDSNVEKIGPPALLHAIKWGQSEVAKLLLQDPRIDPIGDIYGVLMGAYWSDRKDIGGIILKSPRLRLDTGKCQDLLINATLTERLDWVNLLLESGRVDPASDNNRALMLAVQHNRLPIVERLLRDHRVDPSARHNEALKNAIGTGNLAMAKLLFRDWRVKRMNYGEASRIENSVIIDAASTGHYEMVQFLMSDLHVDPSVLQNQALKDALERGDMKMAEILLEDLRVKALAREEYYAAIRNKDAETIQLLRKAPGIDGLARETFNE